ncbi:MAG: bifunctional folylpolyglutamate synthase/dihydrofolate synthase [Synergistaceae bacterium]|jgi:dihydrofolate synthase/folylpolyglutamate synthase|nr:bifunctional folylpolyglutamate synthase/dihydrofolate synthase [Synergistaceae bacterium]
MDGFDFAGFASLERRLQGAASPGSRPGLSRLARLCRFLGHPERSFRAVHVVGTNGKGSTAATLASILSCRFSAVGLYTSPHLECLGERIRFNDKQVPLALWEEGFRAILDAMGADEVLASEPPTLFELLTALSFWLFRRLRCEIAVFEAGMGGRLDATNLLPCVVLTLITPIAEDHKEYLGSTLAEIAAEKFAVLRPGVPVLFAGGDEFLERLFMKRARETGALANLLSDWSLSDVTVSSEGTSFFLALTEGEPKRFRTSLLGRHQAINAAMALCGSALIDCGHRGDGTLLQEGLDKTTWPGRLELVREDPVVLFDGGHNPHGLEAALNAVEEIWPNLKNRAVLFATMADKDYRTELLLFKDRGWSLVFTEVPEVPRSETVGKLRAVVDEVGLTDVTYESRLDVALDRVCVGRDLALCCGSLYLIGALKSLLRSRR